MVVFIITGETVNIKRCSSLFFFIPIFFSFSVSRNWYYSSFLSLLLAIIVRFEHSFCGNNTEEELTKSLWLWLAASSYYGDNLATVGVVMVLILRADFKSSSATIL